MTLSVARVIYVVHLDDR